jgi:hypothetical protein
VIYLPGKASYIVNLYHTPRTSTSDTTFIYDVGIMRKQTLTYRIRNRAYGFSCRYFEKAIDAIPRRHIERFVDAVEAHIHDRPERVKLVKRVYRFFCASHWHLSAFTEWVSRLTGLSSSRSPRSSKRALRYKASKLQVHHVLLSPGRRWRRRRERVSRKDSSPTKSTFFNRSQNLSSLEVVSQPKSILFRIPPEIAQLIYDFALGGNVFHLQTAQRGYYERFQPEYWTYLTNVPCNMVLPNPSRPVTNDHPFTALLYVCRQVYGLAVESLYRQNSFVFPETYPGGGPSSFVAIYPGGNPAGWSRPLREIRHGMCVRPIHQMARFQLGLLPERIKDIRSVELQLWNPPSRIDIQAAGCFNRLEKLVIDYRHRNRLPHREHSSDLAWVEEICRIKGLRQFVMHISHVTCYSPSDWISIPSHFSMCHPIDDLDSGGDWSFEDVDAWSLTYAVRSLMLGRGWTGKYYGSGQEYFKMAFTR